MIKRIQQPFQTVLLHPKRRKKVIAPFCIGRKSKIDNRQTVPAHWGAPECKPNVES